MTNISCQFEIYTYNTLCSRGPTKVLALSGINIPGSHLVFQNEAKNIPRQHFMVINITCKLEKASYNIFFVRAVMVKSLYTLRLSSGYNDLLNSENLRVAIAQLCHDIQVCNFTMLKLTKNYVNNIFKQNTLNALVFELQLIFSTVITSN